jgi:hypothetical protein
MGVTCDLRAMRHATINIERYWEDLKAGISFDLIANQIEKYEKRMN